MSLQISFSSSTVILVRSLSHCEERWRKGLPLETKRSAENKDTLGPYRAGGLPEVMNSDAFGEKMAWEAGRQPMSYMFGALKVEELLVTDIKGQVLFLLNLTFTMSYSPARFRDLLGGNLNRRESLAGLVLHLLLFTVQR